MTTATSVVTVTTTIQQFEERAMNTWPPLQMLCYDGWLLQFANGYTRRANSVNPIYPASLDVDEKIRYCETVYTQRGQKIMFKLTSNNQDLDRILVEHGYVLDSPSKVLVADDLSSVPPADYQDVQILTEASPFWIDSYVALSGTELAHADTMRQIFANIRFPKALAVLYDGQAPIAIGLAVVERDYVSFFSVVVSKDKRGQGIGNQLMRHLIAWGKASGAQRGFLQVMRDNLSAVKLYTGLGFRDTYDYWYRVKESTVNLQHASQGQVSQS